jgi:hypothetical protein
MTTLMVNTKGPLGVRSYGIFNEAVRTERAIYMVKRLPNGGVLAYDRHYDLIGTVVSPEEVVAALAQRYGIDVWRGYTGGSDGSVGDATWLVER